MSAVSAPGNNVPGGNIGRNTGGKPSALVAFPSELEPPTTEELPARRLEPSAEDLAAKSANLAKGNILEFKYSDKPTKDGASPGKVGI